MKPPSHPFLVVGTMAGIERLGVEPADVAGRGPIEGRRITALERAVAVAGGTVLVSASKSERGERSAVYRRPLDGTRPLERCREGLPEWFTGNINTGCLVADGATAVIGDPDGSLYLSRDEGATWSLEHRARARVTCLSLGRLSATTTD
jgi:hypothetical protein